MKLGFIADLHLSITDSLGGMDPKIGLSYRTIDRLEALTKALTISYSEGCKYFILGGDIYDKLNPPEKLKEAFNKVIGQFFDTGMSIVIIPGNHDGSSFIHNYKTEQTIINSMPDVNWPLIIIDKPQAIYLNNEKFLFLPWTMETEKIQEAIDEVEPGIYCFGHIEISGAVSSTEFTLTSGFHPSTFQKFKKVYLGHYHRRQIIKNIEYVGSPIIKDFSELEVEKGFLIIDTNGKDEFYQLEKRKAFQFRISPDTIEDVDAYLTDNPPPQGSLIKIRIEGDREWVTNAIPVIKQIFGEFKPLKLKVEKIYTKHETLTEVDNILEKSSRVERIKELTKGKDPEFVDYGLNIYRAIESEYLESETGV